MKLYVQVTRYMNSEEANSQIISLYGALPRDDLQCRNAESLNLLFSENRFNYYDRTKIDFS